MKAVIFHGTLGSPEGNWFPWLRSTLTNEGWNVAIPSLPTPKNQSLDSWTTAFKNQMSDPNDIDLLIGHSLGATFILRLLENNLVQPQQVILVSAFIDKIDNVEYDTLNHSFINHPYQWDMIKQNSKKITLLHGSDDPYVPLEQPKTIAKNLGAPLHTIKNGGHLNTESGYTEFPDIFSYIHE